MKAVKILAMGTLALAAWSIDWLLLKQIIYHDLRLTFLAWPSLATVLGITFLTFFFLINKNRLISLILDVLIFAGYVMIMPKNPYVILGGAIFFVFLVLFEQRIMSEEKSRADFSIRRVMSDTISLTIYALLLLIGFNIYYSTQTDLKANPNFYYARLEQTTARTVPYVTKGFTELSEEQKQQLTSQLAAETADRVKQFASEYESYFPFVLAIIVTASLWTFAFLIRWTTAVVGWLIFRFLILTGFFKLEKVQVEVNKLTI